MTTEERFERIENALIGITQIERTAAQSLGQLTETFSQFAHSADARMTRVEENLTHIVENMTRIGENITRIEENLDGLIRVTADHQNGKSKH